MCCFPLIWGAAGLLARDREIDGGREKRAGERESERESGRERAIEREGERGTATVFSFQLSPLGEDVLNHGFVHRHNRGPRRAQGCSV